MVDTLLKVLYTVSHTSHGSQMIIEGYKGASKVTKAENQIKINPK